MDPSLLQPSLTGSTNSSANASASANANANANANPSSSTPKEDVKPSLPAADIDANQIDMDDTDDHGDDFDDDMDGSGENVKRPRLRLAHACDRCRKRKIRCDTQQPCGPCQATRNECTFHTPSRRISKPKVSGVSSGVGAGGDIARSSSAGGVKRPHSPQRSSTAAGLLSGGNPANLEARLAALESMLRDVPPNVHNAFLSTLDARLGSGTGVGIKEGKGEGVGVAVEALAGTAYDSLGLDGTWGAGTSSSSSAGLNALSALGRLGSSSTLAPGLGDFTDTTALGWGRKIEKRKEEEGVNEMAKRMEGMSFFYEDEIGQAKWQGATSGFPLLDILTAKNASPEEQVPPAVTEEVSPNNSNSSPADPTRRASSQSAISIARGSVSAARRAVSANPPSPSRKKERFFPDRTPRPHQTLNPEASWKVITGVIPPDLMDTLVRCYLSTSHLLWPFLHVPSFLADYANPQQWGEPGFACFIVAVCTLSSRHVDDPRVRANPSDPSTAGKQYFELFKRLRDLPSADRPTLYSIQAAFLAAIYAFGLGNLSKAFALQAESITLCLDGGLHRSVDGYDHFDPVEKETRKRTFWSIYSWDKQSAALFGRPPIIHLRDCDVTEPLIADDENLTAEGLKDQPNETTSRICAFVAAIRLHVILEASPTSECYEGVIDSATQPSSFPTSPFLARAAATIARRSPQNESLRDEESLLEEWTRLLPKYWHYDTETANSRDPIRITQAERLHCLEHLVKMIIYRHKFSGFVAMPASTADERARHLDLCRKAMQCALTIIADHVHISQRGMMTYYGVHVIHQLAQAGRTLVAVILNCRNADFRPLISPAIEGLRSCVGLLRRFSGRYLCGLRSADIIDEFCRICNIPVDSPRVPDGTGRPSPAWLRPVRRKPTPPSSATPSHSDSPSATYTGEDIMSAPPDLSNPSRTTLGHGLSGHAKNPSLSRGELDALFNTSEYFDLSAMSPGVNVTALDSTPNTNANTNTSSAAGMASNTGLTATLGFGAFGDINNSNNANGMNLDTTTTPTFDFGLGSMSGMSGMAGMAGMAGMDVGTTNGGAGVGLQFDYGGSSGFGGEMLAGEGMDTVSDGLKSGENQGLSAATILSLLEQGNFDYGSMFTDQAPLADDFS